VVVAPAGVAGKNVDVRVLYYGKTYAVNSLIIGYTSKYYFLALDWFININYF
jgi:hypothetical protein